MNIKLTNEVFGLPERKKDLRYLIETIVRRHHNMCFDEDFLEVPEWIDDEARETIEAFLSAGNIGDYVEPHCEVVKDASNFYDEKIFDIDEAIAYANTPLTVMLENSNNDSALVLLTMDLYTKVKTSVYYDEGQPLVFGHAGGCGSIKSVIEEKLRQYRDRSKMLRYYVIVDGDRRYKDHVVAKYNTLTEFLDEKGIKWHVFEKRCMENYMPIDAFPRPEANVAWLNAFRALSPLQRDFFNIGGGFRGDLSDDDKKRLTPDNSNIRELMKPQQRDFYSDVSDLNLKRLAVGYNLKSFKEEFPKGFNSATVTRRMLDQIQSHQQNPAELQYIASDITKLL